MNKLISEQKFPYRIENWGMIDYSEALRRQKKTVREVVSGGPQTLVLCEHPPVITLGRTYQEKSLLLSCEKLAQQGVGVVTVDRGGDVTLHAPGQLVAYPIIDLKRAGLGLRGYLQNLEQVAVDFLKSFGIVAQGNDDRRGVWVAQKKIASIGIGVTQWVTYHGMAVNLSTDLSYFQLIRPCGLDVQMTSVKELTGSAPDMTEAGSAFAEHFLKVLSWSRS